jgi:hypothetical protein
VNDRYEKVQTQKLTDIEDSLYSTIYIFEVYCTDLDEVTQNLFTGGPHVIPLNVLVFTQNTIPMEEFCIRPSASQIYSEKMSTQNIYVCIFPSSYIQL